MIVIMLITNSFTILLQVLVEVRVKVEEGKILFFGFSLAFH